MPIFDTDTEDITIAGGNFAYSAAKPDALDEADYTLVLLGVDVSGSVTHYKAELEKCLKDAVAACHRNPRSHNILLRIVLFNHTLDEICGYIPLVEINTDNLTGVIRPGGTTALYETCEEGVRTLEHETMRLRADDIDSNCLFICITDGVNYMPQGDRSSLSAVTKAFQGAVQNEKIGSITTILVAVNAGSAATELETFNKAVGFTQFVDIGDATPDKMAKLAEFISKSTSTVSNSLGGSNPTGDSFVF